MDGGIDPNMDPELAMVSCDIKIRISVISSFSSSASSSSPLCHHLLLPLCSTPTPNLPLYMMIHLTQLTPMLQASAEERHLVLLVMI